MYLDRRRYTVLWPFKISRPNTRTKAIFHTKTKILCVQTSGRSGFFFLHVAIRNSLRSNKRTLYVPCHEKAFLSVGKKHPRSLRSPELYFGALRAKFISLLIPGKTMGVRPIPGTCYILRTTTLYVRENVVYAISCLELYWYEKNNFLLERR